MLWHDQIAVLCFTRLSFLFCAVLSWLSMAEAPVAIPTDVLEATRPAAIPLPEPPAGGENPALPA